MCADRPEISLFSGRYHRNCIYRKFPVCHVQNSIDFWIYAAFFSVYGKYKNYIRLFSFLYLLFTQKLYTVKEFISICPNENLLSYAAVPPVGTVYFPAAPSRHLPLIINSCNGKSSFHHAKDNVRPAAFIRHYEARHAGLLPA